MSIASIGRALRRRAHGEDGVALLLVMGMMLALSLVAVAGLSYATQGLTSSRHEQDFDTDSAATEAAAQDFLHHLNICDDYWAGAAFGAAASTCFTAANNSVTNPALVAAAPVSWSSLPYVPGTSGQSNGQYAYQVIGVPFATGAVGTAAVTPGTIRLQVWGHSRNVTRTQVVDFKRASLLNFIYYTDIEGESPNSIVPDYPPYTATVCPEFYVINSDNSLTGVTNAINCSFSGLTMPAAMGACDQHWYSGPAAPGTTNPLGSPAPGRSSDSYLNFYGTVSYTVGTTNYSSAKYVVLSGASTSSYGNAVPSCQIVFGGGDSINGPLHTNDAINLGGAVTFGSKQTETSWGFTSAQNNPAPGTNKWIDSCGGCTPGGNLPVQTGLITLPPSNASLQSQAEGTNKGCEYTGPTQITLNSNGTMTVLSPDTTSASPPVVSSCYTSLPMTSAETVPLPSNGVVYVKNAASTSACSKTTRPYVGVYPAANDYGSNSISCTQGDAYLKGTLKGQLTIGASGNIDVVGDTTYNGGLTGTDILGLIANGFVQVYHPVSCTSAYNDPGDGPSSAGICSEINSVPSNGITIDAAILSVANSFTVENFDKGSALSDGGTAKKLHINGVIAQEFRGAVGTGSSASGTTTGYLKDYNYDNRLQNDPPPYFLDPTSSPWQVFATSEQ